MLLDSRPTDPNRALQMETQHVPSLQAVDAKGQTYARIAPTFFPAGADGQSRLVHHITSYNKRALWDAVKDWLEGGAEASGAIRPEGAVLHPFTGKGGATWRIYPDGTAKEEKVPVAWSSFATPTAPDPNTFGYRWDPKIVKQADAKSGPLVKLPEYFRLDKGGAKPQWVPVRGEDVPAETGVAKAGVERPKGRRPKTYSTPEDAESCWKKPGPKAGPFQARPGDGSVVTYYWYRFADQPAILNADLTDREREALQARVEKLHRTWTKDRDYLAPPASGKLADLDSALIVTPPPGLEIGYVPIVTRQASNE
jgi:hypothetical protein